MNTQDFLRKPRFTRVYFPPGAVSVLPRAASNNTGDWRYASAPKTRGALALALVAAASLHAAMFYGFQSSPPRARVIARPQPAPTIQIAMPPMPPEESDNRPRELTDEPAAVITVPQLADIPSTVALSDFSQTLDLRPQADVDVGALKSMTIPVVRGRGVAGLDGQSTIFNLSQLDRVPQPISQPMPNFPKGIRIPGLEEAVVVVEFVVDADGRVIEPRVTRSDASEFNSAALVGITRWKFRPGILAGRKVSTRMEVPLKFDLKTGE